MAITPEEQRHASTRTPLRARSSTEIHLYLDLHPCECGTARPRDVQELRGGEEGYVSAYEGTCPGCGRPWHAEFSLPVSAPPQGSIGDGPSAIICPGEFVWLSDRESAIPASGPRSPAARARLALAAAELEEAAKFIPEGSDRVPAEALASAIGQALNATSPRRFLKTDLSSRARLCRAGMPQDG